MNNEDRGIYLGAFKSDDKILTIQKSGYYKLMSYELTNHFEEDMILIEKFNPAKIMSVVYFDGSQEKYYIKRFGFESENNINKRFDFIGETDENQMISFSLDFRPQIKVIFDNTDVKKPLEDEIIDVEDFIGVKSEKAKGKRITTKATKKIDFIEPLPYEEEIPEENEAIPEQEEKVPEQVDEVVKPVEIDLPKEEPSQEDKKSKKPAREAVNPDETEQERLIRKKKEDDDRKQMELF